MNWKEHDTKVIFLCFASYFIFRILAFFTGYFLYYIFAITSLMMIVIFISIVFRSGSIVLGSILTVSGISFLSIVIRFDTLTDYSIFDNVNTFIITIGILFLIPGLIMLYYGFTFKAIWESKEVSDDEEHIDGEDNDDESDKDVADGVLISGASDHSRQYVIAKYMDIFYIDQARAERLYDTGYKNYDDFKGALPEDLIIVDRINPTIARLILRNINKIETI